jgi:hypothetical protein
MSDKPDPIEWDCEGCGEHVVVFGITETPHHQFCAVCAWLCEYVTDPDEMMRLYGRHLFGHSAT